MARSSLIPFLAVADVPEVLALLSGDDLQAPDIQCGDEVAFSDDMPAAGDLALLVMRPETLGPGQAQCLVMRLVTSIPPFVSFPWTERASNTACMSLVVEQVNPAKQLAIRCDQILAVRKFTHIQRRLQSAA